MPLFLQSSFVQISMVSLKGMLVKNRLMSKLLDLLESCSTILVANLNESLTGYSLG